MNSKSNILSWTHYRTLLQVFDKNARDWYEKEAIEQTWSTRTLQRNIDTQYYYRLMKSQIKEPVIKEMKEKTKKYDLMHKLEFIKSPVIAEFLGYSLNNTFTETDLEMLAEKAMNDPCRPGNPRDTTKEDFINLFRAAM